MRLQRDMGYSTGVALSQVLFDFGQNLSLIHAAQRSAESAAADGATQHDTVVLDVEQAYFGLLASYRLRDVADETVADNQKHITLDVRQATLNLRQAVESIRVADKGLQQARENLEIAEGRYRTDVGNIIELTDAQTSLTSAEASRVQAVVNYRTALASLERATAHPFSAE